MKKNKNYPYIIAEIGINHDGSLARAIKLIKLAKKAGVDAVKFQLFKPETLAINKSKKTNLQKKSINKKESLHEMFKRVSLNEKKVKVLKRYTKKLNMDFICSIFDLDSFNIAKNLSLDAVKIASSDINDLNLVKKIRTLRLPIIFSTGMANLNEIKNILKVIGKKKVFALHCVSMYPTKLSDINLSRMQEIRRKFNINVGFSDHTLGIHSALMALSMGAQVIEKHFTDNKKRIGADHLLSADLKDMIKIVKYSKDISKIIGSGNINPKSKEAKYKKFFRKGVYASKVIKKGEKITYNNIVVRRPFNSFPLKNISKIINRPSKKNYFEGQSISTKK